jgi:hypothetical protein
MKIHMEHITQIEQKLESLSALVLILKNESFSITSSKNHTSIDLESMYLYKICNNPKRLDFLQYLIKIVYI